MVWQKYVIRECQYKSVEEQIMDLEEKERGIF